MSNPIVALFDEIAVARQVVEDLVKAGFSRSDISLIMNDSQNQYSRYLEKDYAPREDAVTGAEGAGFGSLVGALTGVLVGLIALTIPGIGLAMVAGPIVAGLTGAVAGALTGGIVGALVKTGVPEDEAPYYAEAIRRGATLISLHSNETLRAEELIHRYGTINIHERITFWRQDGWKGFDTESVGTEDETKQAWELSTVTTRETTSTKLSPISPIASSTAIVEVAPPVEAAAKIAERKPLLVEEPKTVELSPLLVDEPAITNEDTEKSLPSSVEIQAESSAEALLSSIEEEAETDYTADVDEFPLIEVARIHPKE